MKQNFIIFIILLLTSCVQKKISNIVVFEHIEDYKIPLTKKGKSLPYAVDFHEFDTAKILSVYYNYPEIVSYNLETEKIIERISINYFSFTKLLAFNYHNSDSIFLIFNAAYNKNYSHDSTILMINSSGEIKDNISLKGAPVWCSENPVFKRDSVAFTTLFLNDFFYKKDKLFFHLLNYTSKEPGDVGFLKNKFPLGGHIDIKDKKFTEHDISYPYFEDNRYYQNATHPYTCFTHNNTIIYAFRHTGNLIEYDFENRKRTMHYVKSSLVDSIKPDTIILDNNYGAVYQQLYYNSYEQKYIRIVKLQVDKKASPYLKNHPKFSLMLLDTNFNVLGECIFPEGFSFFPMLFTKEGIIIRNIEKNTKDSIVFSLFKLNTIKGTKKQLLKHVNFQPKNIPKETGIEAYLEKKHYLNKEKMVVILLPINRSCLPCVNYVCKYYSDSINILKENNVFLILNSSNKESISLLLEENNISENLPNLLFDENNDYLNYIEGFFNPKVIFVKNNEIVEEKIYEPNDLYFLHDEISDFIK